MLTGAGVGIVVQGGGRIAAAERPVIPHIHP
jgi:hypothetical protein